jgi:putative transposase
MPRRAHVILPDVPLHQIKRNNRQACLFAVEDYCFYLNWLGDYARALHCRLHAWES